MKKLLILIASVFILAGCSSSNGYYNDSGDYYDESDTQEPEITRDNWECTEDCSGHEAGYEWAEDKGISDPYDCGGKSQSFIEGCEAYANEQMQNQDEEYDDYQDEDYLY